MSHSHTHTPGESCSHSHSHGSQPPNSQGPVIPPPIDPAIQARIDQSFKTVKLKLSEDRNHILCDKHKLEKCDRCGVDYTNINRLSSILANNESLLCPPPSNVVTQRLTTMVTSTKDEGNGLFKSSNYAAAINRYTAAAQFAASRPPWESSNFMREELSTVISNRSAAYFEARDFVSALADADFVISVRRNWSKGHFRRAKALLGLGKLRDASDAVSMGLSFEPGNQELSTFLAEIERVKKKMQESKAKARLEKANQATVEV